MIKQYIFVLKNDTFFSQSVGRKQLFWFFEALDCVNVKTKCAVCAVGFKLAENGSADLRSPEKEVYFRSWDLANSQMCEVRVATSNICGCNPPNRCGERSGADFATSARGLAFGRD